MCRYAEFREAVPLRAILLAAAFCLGLFFADAAPALSASGQKNYTNSIGMEFVRIPAGAFKLPFQTQNSSGEWEKQDRTCIISKPFYMGKYVVTQEQWMAVMGKNPSSDIASGHPVDGASWSAIQEFIKRLNAKEKHARYRLPTEMEWEYAARGGTDTVYFFMPDSTTWADADVEKKYPDADRVRSAAKKENDSVAADAWLKENANNTTHPVGQKKPNQHGLYDMYGNVREWVQDWYYYLPTDQELWDYRGPAAGRRRVLRGGGMSDSADDCGLDSRGHATPDFRAGDTGFRLAYSSESGQQANSIGMDFVLIPAGSFTRTFTARNASGVRQMKSSSFIISRDFYLGKYEVTQAQWEAVMGNNPSEFKGPDNPVDRVSWNDVQEFIRRLNAREGTSRYRLPTDMEWELAAGGSDKEADTTAIVRRAAWREAARDPIQAFENVDIEEVDASLADYAWFRKNSAGAMHPVGQKKPNPYGLYDIYGNVHELVRGGYKELPAERELTDYSGPKNNDSDFVIRGGSFMNNAAYCRSGSRMALGSGGSWYSIGLRLVMSLE